MCTKDAGLHEGWLHHLEPPEELGHEHQVVALGRGRGEGGHVTGCAELGLMLRRVLRTPVSHTIKRGSHCPRAAVLRVATRGQQKHRLQCPSQVPQPPPPEVDGSTASPVPPSTSSRALLSALKTATRLHQALTHPQEGTACKATGGRGHSPQEARLPFLWTWRTHPHACVAVHTLWNYRFSNM